MQPSENPSPQSHPRTEPALSATGRKLKTLAVSVTVILALGFFVVYFVKSGHEGDLAKTAKAAASTPPLVQAITVEKAPPSTSLVLPGATAAWYESVIYARVDGYVGSWSADIGDHVQKGQVLATLETPDLDAQLTAAQAKLKASQALVEFTQSTYERWKDSPTGVVSEQERESKKADNDRAIAQEGLDQADVDRYTTLAAFKQVTAPFDGTITERHIDIGNLVTAGSTTGTTPLYRIVQDDPIRVFADVPQSAAPYMKTDLAAHITASDLPGRTFDGKITRTADAISEQTRTLRVEVDIPNPDHVLVSGMYVNIAFDVPNEGLIQVPAAALSFHTKGPQIAVIGDDGKIDFRNVTIARDNGNVVEISSGIAAGDKVALNIGNQIAEGEKVHVQNPAGDENAHAQQ